MTDHEQCHETVDAATRKQVLNRDDHRCQVCGRLGPGAGGLAILHVHHIERDPDGINEHDLSNLTTLCRSCHSWQHQKTTTDDAPVEITEADQTVLLPKDIHILRVLAEEGPASPGEITKALTEDASVMAVRERLWVLMGLDNIVKSRDRQVVDQAVETGEWGLTEQIATSARGRIPENPRALLQRIEDEYVRQALARGIDRETIGTVLDISRRTTFYKEKRAQAYDFPLDAIDNRGRKPPAETVVDQRSPSPSDIDDEEDQQQRLDVIADDTGDGVGEVETWGDTDEDVGGEDVPVAAEQDGDVEAEGAVDEDADSVRALLQEAIDALGGRHETA